MKTLAPLTHFLTVSGAAGANNPILLPRDGRLVGIDIAAGACNNEAAGANQYIHLLVFMGPGVDVTSPTNDAEVDNCLGGIASMFRSNATFASGQNMNKFIPLNLPVKSRQTFTVVYRVSAGVTLYAWITFMLEV